MSWKARFIVNDDEREYYVTIDSEGIYSCSCENTYCEHIAIVKDFTTGDEYKNILEKIKNS